MDKRVFRLAVLTIFSAFILVLVIVYATNARQINDLLGIGQKKEAAQEAADEEASGDSSSDAPSYGDQIGDDLGAFMLDESFFDETEQVPSVVVIQRKTSEEASKDSSENISDYVKDTPVSGETQNAGADMTGAEDAAAADSEDVQGTGMAVVGQLINPNPGSGQEPAAAADSSGYLTSIPQAPPGGFGQYIPPGETIGGTPVGDLP